MPTAIKLKQTAGIAGAAANIANNAIVRGDGGLTGIQGSVPTISDAGLLNMGSNLISGVTNPVSDQDAATKKWVTDNFGGGLDEKVKVDSGAAAGYLGAAASDGVLRVDSSLSYGDGGNFVTLAVVQAEIDHGSIGGRDDDDHTQYAKLLGRSGGQVHYGGTASGENLTLHSTFHATKGKIYLGANSVYDQVNDRLGIGTNSPDGSLDIEATGSVSLILNSNNVNPYAGFAFQKQGVSKWTLDYGTASTDHFRLYNGSLSAAAITVDLATNVSLLVQEGWTAPSLLNSWVNLGSGYNPAGYFKDSVGIVHLRGTIKSGTMKAAAFVLPVGYRPAYTTVFSAIGSATKSSLNILANGEVQPYDGANAWFSIDGATFRAV